MFLNYGWEHAWGVHANSTQKEPRWIETRAFLLWGEIAIKIYKIYNRWQWSTLPRVSILNYPMWNTQRTLSYLSIKAFHSLQHKQHFAAHRHYWHIRGGSWGAFPVLPQNLVICQLARLPPGAFSYVIKERMQVRHKHINKTKKGSTKSM